MTIFVFRKKVPSASTSMFVNFLNVRVIYEVGPGRFGGCWGARFLLFFNDFQRILKN